MFMLCFIMQLVSSVSEPGISGPESVYTGHFTTPPVQNVPVQTTTTGGDETPATFPARNGDASLDPPNTCIRPGQVQAFQ
jgi:hypothetical protein